jgi:hypothetical protein
MAQGLGAEVRTSRPTTWTQCRQRGGAVIRGSLVMLDLAGSDSLTADWDGVSASKLGTQAAASGPLGTVLEATEGLTIGRVGVLMSPTVKDDGLGEYELGEVGGGLVAPVVVENALVLVDAASVAGAAVQVGASGGTACFAVGAGATYGILLEACTTDDGKGPSAALNYRAVLLHSQGVGSANATLAAGSVGTAEIADDAVTSEKIDEEAILRSHIADPAGLPGIQPGADLRTSTAYATASWAPTDGGELEYECSIYGMTAWPSATHGILGTAPGATDWPLLRITDAGAIQFVTAQSGTLVSAAAAMPRDGMKHTLIGGLSGGNAYIKLDGTTIATAASAVEAPTVADTQYINFNGLSSQKLGGVLYQCTLRDLDDDTNTYTWRCDEQVSPFANSHSASGVLSMVWSGFFPQADVPTLDASFVAPTARPRWYTTFDATTSWGAAAAGYYTISIAQTTHGIPAPRRVTVWEGTTDLDIVFPDRIRVTAAHAVEIRVTDAPDERFAGALEIG